MRAFTQWCDRLVFGGLVAIVVAAPLAFGAVHPWAYGSFELWICALAAIWMLKLAVAGPPSEGSVVLPRGLCIALGGFLALVFLQTLPLPPSLLRVLSPSSYELYTVALPGWPERAPYSELVEDLVKATPADGVEGGAQERATPVLLLPSVEEAERYGLEDFEPAGWRTTGGGGDLEADQRGWFQSWIDGEEGLGTWRTISLAPARTRAELLKIASYLLLFLLATAYPVAAGTRSRQRFQRGVLRALVLACVAVALLGLLQRMAWNGKLLWFFVPWDWGTLREIPQTSGPFVSRNNFGGYLALLLPLVLSPVLFATRIDLKAGRRATRILFGAGAVVVSIALLWSVSRGAWIAGLGGVLVFLWLVAGGSNDDNVPVVLRSRRAAAGTASLVVLAIVGFTLLPVGDRVAGNDIDRRLEESVSDSASWDSRVDSWKDTIPMVGEFPLFGSGLGTWRDSMLRYDTSYRMGTRAHRAHNDYLQLLAESGFLGFGLMAFAVWGIQRVLRRVLGRKRASLRPILAASVGGVTALALHEFVDFDLQMPAIVMTLMVLLGVLLRSGWQRRRVSFDAQRRRAAAGLVLSVGLATLVVVQPTRFEPRDLKNDLRGALLEADRFPASALPRLDLAADVLGRFPTHAREILQGAVTLDPQAPGPRDALAAVLAQTGERQKALVQLEESVARSPYRLGHSYLATSAVHWLSDEESAAVERGFARALPEAGPTAAVSLATFHASRQDHVEAAGAWQRAANLSDSSGDQARYLQNKGAELARAGRLEEAETALRDSIALAPHGTGAYVVLLVSVLGERGEIPQARELAEAAAAGGADIFEVDLALGFAAQAAGDPKAEVEFFRRAAQWRPASPRGHYALGQVYFRTQRFEPAAHAFRRAIEADPSHASSWYLLGLTEERLYRFAQAREAFAKALALHPTNGQFRRAVRRFSQRLARNSD